MGKIRIKTLGLDDIEKKQKADAKKRRDIKKATKSDRVKAPQGKGGERMRHVEVGEEDLVKQRKAEEAIKPKVKIKEGEKKSVKKKKEKIVGKKYKKALKSIERDKKYSIDDAIKLLKKIKYTEFDESVELHLSVSKIGLRGEVLFPHSIGKKRKIVILNDSVLENIERGDINFDMLITTPDNMPKIVKYAKILGPKGLMPNPKRGTVTNKPEEAMKKFLDGATLYKTEPKFPLIHQVVGKISFKEKYITENISAFVRAIGVSNIKEAHVNTTMSPSITLEIE